MPVGPLPHRMTAGDVMTTTVVTATPDTPIKMIGQLLWQHRISGVPIVDASGRILGIVTEADLLLGKEAAAGERFEPLVAPLRERRERAKARAEVAGQAMTSPAVTITADTPLAAVARVMRKHRVKRLPVVDDAEHVIGILSRHDLLSALARPDAEIQGDVVDWVLRKWLGVDPGGIDVAVEDGIVTLTGQLDRRSDAEVLEHLVHSIDGVVAVRSHVTFRWDDTRVKPTPEHPVE